MQSVSIRYLCNLWSISCLYNLWSISWLWNLDLSTGVMQSRSIRYFCNLDLSADYAIYIYQILMQSISISWLCNLDLSADYADHFTERTLSLVKSEPIRTKCFLNSNLPFQNSFFSRDVFKIAQAALQPVKHW